MNRRYNPRLITSRRSYTSEEIATLLGISKKTVFLWLKGGLRPLEKNTRPLLVMGEELRRFLAEMRKRHGSPPLKENELFCLKCKRATQAKSGTEVLVPTGKRIGKEAREQFVRRGKSEQSGTKVKRYV